MMDIKINKIDMSKKHPTITLSDGRQVTVPLETVVKFKLKENMMLSQGTIGDIIYEAQLWLCKDAGLNNLKSRNKSFQEMKSYLESKGYANDVINETLAFLEDNFFLDDRVLADDLVANSIRKDKGSIYIKEQLFKKGVSNDLANDLLAEYSEDVTEYERCKKYVENYLENESISHKLLMKLSRKLVALGYPHEIIEDVLEQYLYFDGFDNE